MLDPQMTCMCPSGNACTHARAKSPFPNTFLLLSNDREVAMMQGIALKLSKDEAEAWLKEDVSGSVPGRHLVAPITAERVGAQRAAVEATGRIMHYIRKPNVLCLSFGPNV